MTSAPSSKPLQSLKKSRALLYIPLGIGALVIVAYGILWRNGADIMRTEINHWVSTQQQTGMSVAYERIKVSGFPFFLRATISQPALKSPDGWTWHSPKLFIDASPLQPDRLIFAPRGKQEITFPGPHGSHNLSILGDDLLFSLKENYLALEGTKINLTQEDITLTIDKLRLNIQQRPELTETILSFDSKGINWQGRRTAHQGTLPLMELILTITAAPDLFQALQTKTYTPWLQANGSLRIDHLRLLADELDEAPPTQITTIGTLSIDQQYYPSGSFETRIKDPAALINTLAAHGLIAADQGRQIQEGLNAMTAQAPEGVALSFTMENGQLKYGPLKIAKLKTLQ